MNFDSIVLASGSHDTPDEGGCVMEYVSLLAGVQWTDLPTCTDPMISRAAQTVNDRLSDTERQRLVPLIPRLLRATPVRDQEKAQRVRVRVACWSARSVLHLIVDDERRAVALRAIETAEAWLRGEATTQECAAAYDAAYDAADAASTASAYDAAYDAADASAATASAAYDAASAASAAYATDAASAASAAYATDAASTASAASAAATATATADEHDLVAFLDELLDQYDKARAEEGVLIEDCVGAGSPREPKQ